MKRKSLKSVMSLLLALLLVVIMVIPQSTDTFAATTVVFKNTGGGLECAYATWGDVDGADGYKAYYKKSSGTTFTEIDNELIRKYDGYWRVDAVGLSSGTYTIKVVPYKSGVAMSGEATTSNITVKAHDRSGFAFSSESKYGTASGAYNDNGTLKSGAQVVYVTASTAKTCTAIVNGKTVTGFQSILDAKQKSGTSNTVICFRIIGKVTLNDLDHISSSSQGLQVKGNAAYANMNITIEGIGDDATFHGFGMLIRNCGNVEVRNIGFMNFLDDGISVDTDNCNLWIHNCDFFYGGVGSDADQAKGDGSLDVKKSQYCTLSYNHFWDSGKCGLIDASPATSGYSDYLTYHHNWFDHSDSRHPRVRNGKNIHVYNNYYDGNSKYGVGATTGSSVFVEANYFEDCKYPMLISQQGSDIFYDSKGTFSGEPGGIIKAYGNYISGATRFVDQKGSATAFDAYVVSSRNETVPSTVVTLLGGNTYSNFDTASTMYSYTAESAESAKETVKKYAGRLNGGDFKWTFTDADDADYDVNTALKSAVTNYTNSLKSVGGIGGSSVTSPSQNTTTTTTTANTSATTSSSGGSGSAPVLSGGYIHNFTVSGKASSFYTITGNLSKSKGTATYAGLTLTQCLKMETSTEIVFTAPSAGTLVLVFADTETVNIKIDGTKIAQSGSVYTTKLSAGQHTIAKRDTRNLFYIQFVPDSGSGVTTPTTGSISTTPTTGSSSTTPTTSGSSTIPTTGSGVTTPTTGGGSTAPTIGGADNTDSTTQGNNNSTDTTDNSQEVGGDVTNPTSQDDGSSENVTPPSEDNFDGEENPSEVAPENDNQPTSQGNSGNGGSSGSSGNRNSDNGILWAIIIVVIIILVVALVVFDSPIKKKLMEIIGKNK